MTEGLRAAHSLRVSLEISSSPLEHNALRHALITYIGNKRALLPFLWQGFERLHARLGTVKTVGDPFSGSGVVARLARIGGYTVHAGDMESYAKPFGTAFLTLNPEEVEPLFAPWGGTTPF